VRRLRYATAMVLAVTLSLFVFGVDVQADAGNPILGTIRGSAVDNGDGTVTISVKGEWNWLSHNSDCNFDRAATGVGIIWNDPTEPGFTVTKAPISAGVGIASLRTGDTVNTIDQMVHPVDRGNVPEGYTAGTWMSTTQGYATNAAGDYPSGQAFNDPTPPAPTTANVAAWKGGCGREPLTATASKTGGPSCGTSPASTTCSAHPWGSWGYEKVYSHTYQKSGLPSQVCVNFYDVHGGGKFNTNTFQVPNGTKEITVNGNGDNSIQTNAFNVNNGANCVSFFFPSLTTSATSATIGGTISDTATLSGAASNAGGSITFKAYPPSDPSCAAAAEFTSSPVAVSGNGTYGPVSFTPTKVGDYHWTASYSGDPASNTQPVSSACGAAGETSTVGPAQPTITTTATTAAEVRTSIQDAAHVTQPANTINTTGAITFNVYGPGDTSCASSLATLGATPATNGTGDYTSAPFTPTTPGVYRWIAHLAADANNKSADTKCNDGGESTTVVDANINLSPLSATNFVGATHTITATVLANDGSGAGYQPFIGALVNFTVTGGATPASGSCTTGGGGTCTFDITSTTPTNNTIHGTTTITVAGVSLTRSTGDTNPGDGPDVTKQFIPVPSTTTTGQFVYPQDKVEIAASGGGNLAGSVTFKLYDNLTNCQANGNTGQLYSEAIAIGGASPQFAETANTSVAVTTNATVYWNVTYASTNPGQLGSASTCTESTAVSYAGNDGAIKTP
jgi:hypothetical protein